ncbi:MAG: adenosylhomocysteinase [Nitrososphaerota archaeon]
MSMDYWVRDIGLAGQGRRKIEWAERFMPVCLMVRKRFMEEKPLRDERIAACLHVTKETAVLVETLRAGGAEVALCASNPLSTQDDVAAALARSGIKVYAARGMNQREYYECIGRALRIKPTITVDDGADLTVIVHKIARKMDGPDVENASAAIGGDLEIYSSIKGGTEETTTGVVRIKSLMRQGLLLYPVFAVNESPTKSLFDNPIGTGQSALDGIIRATGILLAGKRVVVAGYGRVGSGIAMRARGMGAEVIVVEADPVRALMAVMNGYRVTKMTEAARIGDIFITATGDIDVIRAEHFKEMKSGAILANAGHYDVEISVKDLASMAVRVEELTPLVTKYILRDGKELLLIGQGRLVNLVAAEGHPSEVMDLSFSLQALSIEYISRNADRLEKKVYDVPEEIDKAVAKAKLRSMGIEIEELTERQVKYLQDWRLGT